jgi:hypothetical protein
LHINSKANAGISQHAYRPINPFHPSDIDEFYRKKDPRPLMFSHFARGMADKTYDEVGAAPPFPMAACIASSPPRQANDLAAWTDVEWT